MEIGGIMARNLILSGGVAHDYARTSRMLAEVLDEVGIRSEIHEDFEGVEAGALQDFDMLTLNCLRWTCSQPQVRAEWREEWAFELSEEAREGFLAFLARGKGILALHAATICFDDWPEYRRILGAWWAWGESGHPPFQAYKMHICSETHPLTEGIQDFVVEDELYTTPRITDSISPLIEGEWEGKRHPILWVREYGKARICYNALGHGHEAFEHPVNRVLLQRGASWVMKQPVR
jgi:type 1 glutamine amidotransferase